MKRLSIFNIIILALILLTSAAVILGAFGVIERTPYQAAAIINVALLIVICIVINRRYKKPEDGPQPPTEG